MITQKQLGTRIKEIRKSKKITQEKLAEMINVDFGYISKLEVGQNFPSLQTLNKISEALGVDVVDFFNYNEINEIDIKESIIKILDEISNEKQKIIYKIAKAIK